MALTATCMASEGKTLATILVLDRTRASAMTMDTQGEATILTANAGAKAMVRRRASGMDTDTESDLVMAATVRLPTAKTPSLRVPKVRVVHTTEPLKATAIAADPTMDMLPALTAPIEG